MEPWHKVVTPRKEVREGRSFNPDEFAIALEQIVNGTAPEDYRDPVKFFSRTCFTQALTDHAGMVLRRLDGKTENTAPVLTLITQFGGGKTHTLTTLYHIAKNGKALWKNKETSDLLSRTEFPTVEKVKVAVFVGNAWDPQPGKETPWVDIARQLAGDAGVAALGSAAKTTPPGTEVLGQVFKLANGPVLILMDEVLNFFNRHRSLAEPCHAFFDNLCRAMVGTTHGAVVISLPRSQVEMTNWDLEWQEKITKVTRRVAKDLVVNNEAEISEVIRKRLFEDLGSEKVRRNAAQAYADWCFERQARLPSEWTAADTAAKDTKAKEFLRGRFEACYPFHPATLSVFQRKWQALPQYQQTRGTLAMFAQWISWVYRRDHQEARRESFLTLGSAPLDVADFRAVVLGQLGEPRLISAIETDITGAHAHARALDADSKGALRDIHQRVAKTMLFESSGGQKDKVAHLPELRFALGEPDVDTASIDNAAEALASKAFFVTKTGTDGFKIYHKATIRKAVSDRRASLDEETETKPAMQKFVKDEFTRGSTVSLCTMPKDVSDVPDNPKLTLVFGDPEDEWTGGGRVRKQIMGWMRPEGRSPRLFPASLIWCMKKPGREFRDKVELCLAWKRVESEIGAGTLGADYDRADRAEIRSKVVEAEEACKDEVWASYRFVVVADAKEADGIKVIDLGAGHASSSETLCGHVLAALKSQGLLNESVGESYISRHWPPALKGAGAWPLASLRKSFLDGSLTRLMDPDSILRGKIVELVTSGAFGLASGPKPDGSYERVWFSEMLSSDDVEFESDVFLLTKPKAQALKKGIVVVPPGPGPGEPPSPPEEPPVGPQKPQGEQHQILRLTGSIPPEVWNRVGTKLVPKLRAGSDLKMGVEFTVTLDSKQAASLAAELRQILGELGLGDRVRIETQAAKRAG